jgi:hypothetical protein
LQNQEKINGVTSTESKTSDRAIADKSVRHTEILATARSPLSSLGSLFLASLGFIAPKAIALINNPSNHERHKIK